MLVELNTLSFSSSHQKCLRSNNTILPLDQNDTDLKTSCSGILEKYIFRLMIEKGVII